jgi:hypothetical protein
MASRSKPELCQGSDWLSTPQAHETYISNRETVYTSPKREQEWREKKRRGPEEGF